MKENKNIKIAFIVIMIILVVIIVFFMLNDAKKDNDSNENTYSNTSKSLGRDEYVVMNATTNSIVSFYTDRYSNLTSVQINEMKEKRSMDRVTIAIKDGTLSKEGAVVVVTDENDYPYSYGDDFNLQKLKNGEWQDVQTIGPFFSTDFAYKIKEDRTTSIYLNWKDRYGELETGHYKLNLEVIQNDSSKATVSTEFDIQ